MSPVPSSFLRFPGNPLLRNLSKTLRRFRLAKIVRALFKGIFLIPGLPILVVMALVHLLNRKIRIAWISTDRIGHFVPDVCMSLATFDENSEYKAYFCRNPLEPVANEFWLKIFERNLNVKNWLWVVVLASQILKPYTPPWLIRPPRHTRGSQNLEGKTKAPVFLECENRQAQEWLRSKGWTDGDPIVCLMVRDSKYLDVWFSGRPGRLGRTSFDYHNYRDSAIEDYRKAAEWLAEQGCWVFRMGKVVARPLRSDSTRVIDYANGADRSDFLDVWLLANCTLAISTGTGPEELAMHYGRPILKVNVLPLFDHHLWCETIVAPKALYWHSGERLSLLQHVEAEYFYTEQYSEAGIEIRDLTEDEILSVVEEAWGQKTEEGMPVDDGYVATEFFHKQLGHSPSRVQSEFPVGGYRHPKARLSLEWVKRLKNDFQRLDRDWLESR